MAIQKIKEHILTENGYEVVHRESQADMILDKDGNTVQEHIDAGIASEAGAHGFRYNAEAEAFEVYNEDTGEWEEVSSASGGGGTALSPVTGVKTLVASEKAYIKWTDPEDIELSGVKLAEWAGTILVRKAGSVPANRRDGVVVIDSKVRDAYKSTYLVDSGLSNGVTYYYKFFPYTTSKVYTDSESNTFNLTPHAIAPANVSGISAVAAGNGKVAIKWSDPANTVTDGITVSQWASTKVVYKTGSYPTSPTDGTLALNNTTKDAYKTNALTVSGLTNGTTYYFAFFPVSTDGAVNTDASNRITAVPNRFTISAVPSQSGTLTFNGNEQSPVWSNYNTTQLTLGGITARTNAGTYSAEFTPTADYMWADGTTGTKTVEWTIKKKQIAKVTATTTTWAYDGASHIPTWSNYDANTSTISGTTSTQIAVGNFSTGFTPKDNYEWTDGTITTVTIAWSITRASIAVPTVSSTLTYNGSEQSPTFSGYDSNKMTQAGTLVGTNASEYSATFAPKSNYQWSDGTTETKTVKWTIGKATGTLTVNPASITLDKDHTSATFTIGGNYDGTVSIKSNDETVAKFTQSGNTITVNNVNKKTGTTTITVSCTAGTNYTAPSSKTVTVTAKFVTIYGVEWDGTSTTKWSRTDASAGFTDPVPAVSNGNGSSPFDNIAPWSGMVKDSTDTTAGTLVAIPKYYYKLTKSGNKLKLQIADGPAEGFKVSPAHADRGDGKGERNTVWVGRYHCVSGYKSATGAQQVSITRATARTSIHNLGAAYWQWDWAMNWTIKFLYLVEFADWNSQAKIGYGCSASGSKANNGQTDGMTYHTGTTAANRTTYGYTQYRNIEGLWDNVYDWVDGCYYNSNGLNVIMNPNNFSDGSGGQLIGAVTAGWPSAFDVCATSGYEWCIRPTAASGSDSTYLPDYWDFGASYPCLRVGGYYGQGLDLGLFYVDCSSTSYTSGNIGCRLMKLS